MTAKHGQYAMEPYNIEMDLTQAVGFQPRMFKPLPAEA